FAINGQTGKLTCDVPANTKKAFGIGAGVFAGVMGLASLVMYFMGNLESGTALIAAIVALVAAFGVVGALLGQLKQAASQHAAEEYVKPGSFHLGIRYDRFLYETTNRRKIETDKK
ncbi:MAG: hypothetical protein IJB41_01380, partial [Clostridia bacterium]|nr:hypothetical protein [Clostridia bacterium]